jgi:hypothetical protein
VRGDNQEPISIIWIRTVVSENTPPDSTNRLAAEEPFTDSQPTGTESAALWTIGLDGDSPAELLMLRKVHDDSATLSTLPDEIDGIAPDVNPSIDADGPTPVGDLGDEGK